MDPHAHGHHAEDNSTTPEGLGGHGMLVVGTEAMFFSHLPMFMPPHDYQVILEGTLSQKGSDPQRTYRDDRARHPDAAVYTFNPVEFVLPEIAPPAAKRKQFQGALFRGHFEAPPEFPAKPRLVVGDVSVEVTNVVYFQKLTPPSARPEHLEYLLFGKGEEIFLAHLITGPPDFDQIVTAKVTGHQFAPEELRRGVRLQVPGAASSSAQRVKPGKAVSASAQASGKTVAFKVEAGSELYFMERELAE